jgi:hypothetical protein
MNKKILFTLSAFVSLIAIDAFAQVPTTAESERFSDRFGKKQIKTQTTNQVLVNDNRQQPDMKGADKIILKLSSIDIKGN